MHADEEDLARRAAAGDGAAFSLLAERRRRFIYAVAYRVLMNEEDALDAAQETLIKVSRRIGQYRGEGFASWVAMIATREALNIARRPSRRERAAGPEEMAELSETRETIGRGGRDRGDPRERLDREARRKRVERAMGRLPAQQRAILGLRLGEELGSSEIAARLGLSPPQVRSQLSRAVSRLRELLAEPKRAKIES